MSNTKHSRNLGCALKIMVITNYLISTIWRMAVDFFSLRHMKQQSRKLINIIRAIKMLTLLRNSKMKRAWVSSCPYLSIHLNWPAHTWRSLSNLFRWQHYPSASQYRVQLVLPKLNYVEISKWAVPQSSWLCDSEAKNLKPMLEGKEGWFKVTVYIRTAWDPSPLHLWISQEG